MCDFVSAKMILCGFFENFAAATRFIFAKDSRILNFQFIFTSISGLTSATRITYSIISENPFNLLANSCAKFSPTLSLCRCVCVCRMFVQFPFLLSFFLVSCTVRLRWGGAKTIMKCSEVFDSIDFFKASVLSTEFRCLRRHERP
jgi:hypothetical protein